MISSPRSAVFTLLGHQKIRFGLVGALNTLVDLSIYVLLYHLLGFFVANLISTSCGMITSYLLHRTYTFRVKSRPSYREVIQFLLVTASGQWLLQPSVIYIVRNTLNSLALPDVIHTASPKLLAIIVSLVWNYVWYNRIIFKDNLTQKNHDK